ncbi:uncharacterized protein LOC106093662 [Stomoxys calcitrans]|uniref:uncharacterized protein LOC106093662 n=1 Tax=Stomoxys calcitrans TaxID=35570 RepID=UPI0027E2D98D|nr:uncharacterized protein LOC106093662 [Stomoxys calcitrans]
MHYWSGESPSLALLMLLLVSKMTEHGLTVKFSKDKAKISDRFGKSQFNANLMDGIYQINANTSYTMLTTENEKEFLWHNRFGHLNFNDLKKLEAHHMVRGLEDFPNI